MPSGEQLFSFAKFMFAVFIHISLVLIPLTTNIAGSNNFIFHIFSRINKRKRESLFCALSFTVSSNIGQENMSV